jgi:hypothetical protein
MYPRIAAVFKFESQKSRFLRPLIIGKNLPVVYGGSEPLTPQNFFLILYQSRPSFFTQLSATKNVKKMLIKEHNYSINEFLGSTTQK